MHQCYRDFAGGGGGWGELKKRTRGRNLQRRGVGLLGNFHLILTENAFIAMAIKY